MTLYKKIPFTWDNKDYEIRVLYDEAVINVVAFVDSRPANGFRHMLKFSKQCAVQNILESDAVAYLVEVCRRDIGENRWRAFPKGKPLP